MKKESKQNPIVTIAAIHFVITVLILKYVEEFTLSKLLPSLVSGASPTIPLLLKLLIPLSFILNLPIDLISSHFALPTLSFYIIEALNSLIWGWLIVSIYKKFKKV
jgi:hypothetical protein